MVTVTAVHGDIIEQRVDAIVNAANRQMRGGGGVGGAIHRAGGRAILDDCGARFPDALHTGDAGWTTAGAMPATWVIHTVGPKRALSLCSRLFSTRVVGTKRPLTALKPSVAASQLVTTVMSKRGSS